MPFNLTVAASIACHGVLDPIPGIARRMFGPLPCELGVTFGRFPVAPELWFGLVERPASILGRTLPAELVGRPVVLVSGVLVVVRPLSVVLPPVGIFNGRINRLS